MTNNYKSKIFIEMLIWYSPTQYFKHFQHFLRIQLKYFANFKFF